MEDDLPTIITKERVEMAKIRTRYNELLAAKAERESREIDRMDVVREAGVAYPTVVRWEGDGPDSRPAFDRFDSDTVIRLCLFLNCGMGDLLYIDESEEPR